MRRTSTRLAVTLVAALALAGGATTATAADAPRNGGHDGQKVIVKGDNNQVVLGDENVVGRGGDVNGHTETGDGVGEGDETSTVASPYATVRSNVSYLAERERATARSPEIARFGPGTRIPIACYVTGEDVLGNRTWYRVRAEDGFRTGYIAAYYTTLTGAVNPC